MGKLSSGFRGDVRKDPGDGSGAGAEVSMMLGTQ